MIEPITMTGIKLRANADYTVIDRSPIVLHKGEPVTIRTADKAWPGWISITTTNGRQAHVPENILDIRDKHTATLTTDFDSRDLSARNGETFTSLREVHGWHWCRNADSKEGWLPGYLLEAVDANE